MGLDFAQGSFELKPRTATGLSLRPFGSAPQGSVDAQAVAEYVGWQAFIEALRGGPASVDTYLPFISCIEGLIVNARRRQHMQCRQ